MPPAGSGSMSAGADVLLSAALGGKTSLDTFLVARKYHGKRHIVILFINAHYKPGTTKQNIPCG
jgi:phage terminase large subunit-like protein